MKIRLCNIFFVLLLISCQTNSTKEISPIQKHSFVSNFDQDSAFSFVKTQTDFGPRVPGSKAHSLAENFLYSKLKQYCDTVIIQSFHSRIYTGVLLQGENIIGIFNPESQKRILLSAHWDSRPFADQDPDKKNTHIPIDGANDGASGVGVLLEIARQINLSKPTFGIDIIFFDLEDYGPHEETKNLIEGDNWWGLGAQYWAKNPHQYSYKAQYGILLDMVGASNPIFLKEQFSVYFSKFVVEKIWQQAKKLGYENYFPDQMGIPVNDDHYYINVFAKIPTVDIIHQDLSSSNGSFYEYWHTINDNILNIDPLSLKITGDVVLSTIMNE